MVSGAFANMVAIVLGGGIGLLLRVGIPESCKTTVMQAMGLAVVFMGLKMAAMSQENLVMVVSLALGAFCGEIMRLEDGLQRFAQGVTQHVGSRFGDVGQGLVTAGLIYCIGAMGIVGGIQEGIAGDAGILYTKALLDGTMAVIFGASMGIGVVLSGIPVFLYEGAITLLAGSLQDVLTEAMIAEISGTGGILILAIGCNMLEVCKIKLANLLPSLPIAVLLVWLDIFGR